MRPDPGDRVRLADLPKLYRDHAAMLRLWGGAEQSAIVLEHAAKLLEESLEGHLDERLSLAEAELEHTAATAFGGWRIVREHADIG